MLIKDAGVEVVALSLRGIILDSLTALIDS